MPRRLALACALLVLAAPSARAQGTGFTQSMFPKRVALARIGLEPNWIGVVPVGRSERILTITITEAMVFAQTNAANFHAFDVETGRYLWGANLGKPSGHAFPASINSTMVFVTGGHAIYGLDRKTGLVRFKQTLGAMPTSSTAATEDRVVVAVMGNNATDPHAGALVTFYLNNPHLVPGYWSTNEKITARPIPTTHVDAIASHDGKVYVVKEDPAKPRIVHRFLTGGPISASMATYGTRTLLVPSKDHNIYAIDLFTGDKFWNYSTGAPVDQEPLVGNDDVYVMNAEGTLNAIEIKTGRVRWTIETGGGRLLSVGEKRVYLESHDRDLFIVDRQTGTTIASPRAVRERGVDVREFTVTPTNHLTGRIYLASTSGLLICLREVGRIKPFALKDPKAREFGWLPRVKGGEAAQGKEEAKAADEEKKADDEDKPADEEKKADDEDNPK
jgi:outer membrane protein assembly factor BamB